MKYLALAPAETGQRSAGDRAHLSRAGTPRQHHLPPCVRQLAHARKAVPMPLPIQAWHDACVPLSVTPSCGERLP